MMINPNRKIISRLVFLFSMSISLLTIIPALFPALYASIFNPSILDKVVFLNKIQVSSTETGIWFYPIIITCIILFSIYVIFKIKSIKLPTFDVSKKVSVITMILFLILFTGISYQGIVSVDPHGDWPFVKDAVDHWPPGEIGFGTHVKLFLLSTSSTIFGNYRIVPFLASAALIVTTYMITNKITNNRVSGLLSSAIVLQSNLFLTYSSTPTYTTFWVLFYVVSIYLILHKAWILSPVSYIVSLLSKPLTATFLPFSIFFIWNTEIPIKNKIIISSISIIIIGIGAAIIAQSSLDGLNWEEFWIGFTSFSYQLRFDAIIVIFLLPVIIGLFIISKNNRYANNISIMISGILITNPILMGLTQITSQPYRFIPLIVFFAIGAGMLISKNQNKSNQNKSNQNKSKKN